MSRVRLSDCAVLCISSCAVVCLSACTQPAIGTSGDAGTLDDCLADVWQSPRPASCSALCEFQDPPAECDAGDCNYAAFRWLLADHRAVTGYFTYSLSQQTFSSTAPPLVSTWRTEGQNLVVDPDRGMLAPVTCDSAELVTPSQRWARGPAGSEAAFTRAFVDGGWRGRPYVVGSAQ